MHCIFYCLVSRSRLTICGGEGGSGSSIGFVIHLKGYGLSCRKDNHNVALMM